MHFFSAFCEGVLKWKPVIAFVWYNIHLVLFVGALQRCNIQYARWKWQVPHWSEWSNYAPTIVARGAIHCPNQGCRWRNPIKVYWWIIDCCCWWRKSHRWLPYFCIKFSETNYHNTRDPQHRGEKIYIFQMFVVFVIIVERVRYKQDAKMISSNRWPNVTIMYGEVKRPSSSIMVNGTLREMMWIQWLQRSVSFSHSY